MGLGKASLFRARCDSNVSSVKGFLKCKKKITKKSETIYSSSVALSADIAVSTSLENLAKNHVRDSCLTVK